MKNQYAQKFSSKCPRTVAEDICKLFAPYLLDKNLEIEVLMFCQKEISADWVITRIILASQICNAICSAQLGSKITVEVEVGRPMIRKV